MSKNPCKYFNIKTKHDQHSPHPHATPKYGANIQYAPPSTTSILTESQIIYWQQVIGTFLLYYRVIKSTILNAVGYIATHFYIAQLDNINNRIKIQYLAHKFNNIIIWSQLQLDLRNPWLSASTYHIWFPVLYLFRTQISFLHHWNRLWPMEHWKKSPISLGRIFLVDLWLFRHERSIRIQRDSIDDLSLGTVNFRL